MHSNELAMTVSLDYANESKAILKFIEWLDSMFGAGIQNEMALEAVQAGKMAPSAYMNRWNEAGIKAVVTTGGMLREGVASLNPGLSAANALLHAKEGNYEAAVLSAVPLAVHGIAGAAELKPYGGSGGGHHPVAKSAFKGAANYDAKAALAIPNAELTRVGVNHSTVTGAQMTGYTAFAKTRATLTWESMQEIEVQALIQGGMKPDMAKSTVQTAIQALKDVGVAGPTRIPWSK